jgi:hypothetical protein
MQSQVWSEVRNLMPEVILELFKRPLDVNRTQLREKSITIREVVSVRSTIIHMGIITVAAWTVWSGVAARRRRQLAGQGGRALGYVWRIDRIGMVMTGCNISQSV